MTTLTPPVPATSTPMPPAPAPPSPVLRVLGGTALVLSPLLYAVTRFTWPDGSDGTNAQLVAAAAAHPDRWNLSGCLEGLSALCWLSGLLVLASMVTARGRVLTRISLGLAACSAVGFVANWTINAYLAAQASARPAPEVEAGYDALMNSAFLVPFLVLLIVGTLGGVVVLAAVKRARLVPWWVVAVGLAGVVAELAYSRATPIGSLTEIPQLIAASMVARAMVINRPR